MNSSLIHQVWQTIEAAQTSYLLQLDNHHLVNWLFRQLNEHQSLSDHEQAAAIDYLHTRLPLIRDFAESRV